MLLHREVISNYNSYQNKTEGKGLLRKLQAKSLIAAEQSNSEIPNGQQQISVMLTYISDKRKKTKMDLDNRRAN